MRLLTRLERVERVVGRPGEVTWAEVASADQRQKERLIAKLTALADGTPVPSVNPVQERADARVIALWDRQRGFAPEDCAGARERLMQKLARFAGPEEA